MSVNDHTCAGTIDQLTDTMHLRRQSEDEQGFTRGRVCYRRP